MAVKRREGHVRWVDCLCQALASVWSSWKEKVTSNPLRSPWPSAHLMINNTKFAKTCLRKILGLAQNICWIAAVLDFLSVQFGSCCQFAEESYLCHRSVSYPGGKMIAYPYESSHLACWYLIRGPCTLRSLTSEVPWPPLPGELRILVNLSQHLLDWLSRGPLSCGVAWKGWDETLPRGKQVQDSLATHG